MIFQVQYLCRAELEASQEAEAVYQHDVRGIAREVLDSRQKKAKGCGVQLWHASMEVVQGKTMYSILAIRIIPKA
jgi:hypothetical protein